MAKLNVYVNYPIGSCCGGLIVVAANSMEEAHEMCMAADDLNHSYWEYKWVEEKDESGNVGFRRSNERVLEGSFKESGWELISNLTYEGNPCVIASDFYAG